MGTVMTTDRAGTLLFGAVRRDVLALLLGRPDERFYLREIVRAVGSGPGAVQRELRLLVEAGLVHREAHGRHVYFSANRGAVIFPELQSIIAKTAGLADVLRSGLAPLVRRGSVDLAFVFGSVAGGTHSQRSDIDLMVVGRATLTDVVSALRGAAERLGREINPAVYPAKEFGQAARASSFVRRVLTGPRVIVVGDERVLTRLAR